MGTNYYLYTEPPCPVCGRGYEPRHIGKSSCGWVFSLHVYPEDGINDFGDWKPLFESGIIKDEYGRDIAVQDMIETVTCRWGGNDFDAPFTPTRFVRYSSWDELHRANHSAPGPLGLLRHEIGHHCIGYGAGTWDLCIGDFF